MTVKASRGAARDGVIAPRASHRRTSFMALGGRARLRPSGCAFFDLSNSHFQSLYRWRGRGAHVKPMAVKASWRHLWLCGGDRAASVASPHVVHGSQRSCPSETFWLCFVRPIKRPFPKPLSTARPLSSSRAGHLRCLSWHNMATHSMTWRMVR